jgi:hypothetical protein
MIIKYIRILYMNELYSVSAEAVKIMKWKSLIFWIVAAAIVGCTLATIATVKSLLGNSSTFQTNKCGLPYENFSENNILGTWQAQRLNDTDTLIIRQDKTYKQVVHIQNPPIDFESDWQPWYLVYSENNTPYLHLKNLHLCVAEQGIIDCTSVGGCEREWYDLCNDKWVTMPGEGVLAVVNTDKINEPTRLELFLFPLSSENPWVYRLIIR